jgi:hypothetical protein
MVAIIRDRVQVLIKRDATLAQIKAARVTADYDSLYGANSGPWTADMFVEAVYTSLMQPAKNFAVITYDAAGAAQTDAFFVQILSGY